MIAAMRRIALLACLAAARRLRVGRRPRRERREAAADGLRRRLAEDRGHRLRQGFDAATVRASFAGSDELAAQIRQGVKPDVFASANTKLPDELYKEGLVEKPVVFAANELVLAVPADGTVTGLDDLAKPGTTIAMGSESVPVGAYTRKVLDGLPAGQREAILANVRSNEPDVAGVVGKVAQGAVDAGFVYVTDVEATGRQAEGRSTSRRTSSPRSRTVSPWSRAPSIPSRRSSSSTGCCPGPGREALDRAGLPAASGHVSWFTALLWGGAGARAGVPRAAGGGDLRRRRAALSCWRPSTTRARPTRCGCRCRRA